MRTVDVSVVIANRDHGRYLPRALEALLGQSVSPREIIVIDDDSRDDSVPIIEDYARRHPVIQPLKNPRHLGVTATYNRGFGLASGTYVVPAAADDYLLPGFLARSIAAFERHPAAGVCVAHGSCTDGDDGPLVVNDPGWCVEVAYFTPAELCRLVWHTLPVSAIMVRRDALLKAGGYRPELAWYSDWFAFLVVAFRHGAVHLPETLGIHVLQPGSYASGSRKGPENVRILGELLELLMSPDFADVAPWFRRNGAACHFGPDLIRAAASREDRLDPRLLGLLAGFGVKAYEELAADSDRAVCEIARQFLGEPWRTLLGRREDLETENRRLIEEVQLARRRTAPAGVLGKLRWAATLAHHRLRHAVGLHPAGRFR
jgi:glycosyltransferase involved in cell wall biosynthesis